MLTLKHVSKVYKTGKESVKALKNINLEIADGEFLIIVGPSGSGKSTLLNMIGGLDRPNSGKIAIDGININELNDKKLSRIRNSEIGFVFQDFHLEPHLTLLENIELPMIFAKKDKKTKSQIRTRSMEMANALGLKNRISHKPGQVSGGQKQKAAIARALINGPKILLADEPTGNLDSLTGKKIIDLLKDIHKEHKMTLIIVTHDKDIAKHAKRIIEIRDGILIEKNHFERFIN